MKWIDVQMWGEIILVLFAFVIFLPVYYAVLFWTCIFNREALKRINW